MAFQHRTFVCRLCGLEFCTPHARPTRKPQFCSRSCAKRYSDHKRRKPTLAELTSELLAYIQSYDFNVRESFLWDKFRRKYDNRSDFNKSLDWLETQGKIKRWLWHKPRSNVPVKMVSSNGC